MTFGRHPFCGFCDRPPPESLGTVHGILTIGSEGVSRITARSAGATTLLTRRDQSSAIGSSWRRPGAGSSVEHNGRHRWGSPKRIEALRRRRNAASVSLLDLDGRSRGADTILMMHLSPQGHLVTSNLCHFNPFCAAFANFVVGDCRPLALFGLGPDARPFALSFLLGLRFERVVN